MDEIEVQLPTQIRCPESLRLQQSWLMCKTNKIILHTRHYFKELVTVKVAMELIMMVKRTQICRTWNGPVDQGDEHVVLSTNLNFKRVVGCQVFWPLKLWFLASGLVCFENHDNKSCRLW